MGRCGLILDNTDYEKPLHFATSPFSSLDKPPILPGKLDGSDFLYSGDVTRLLQRTIAPADSDADAGTNRDSDHSAHRNTNPTAFTNTSSNRYSRPNHDRYPNVKNISDFHARAHPDP